jgi:serine/threonine protein kinase
MDERIFSGKYQVQGEIARGGMGVIFRALDTKLHRQVAIKILHAHFSGVPDFAERFLREARAMARLDHENIIRVHAVEEEAGAHYIVMEFFQGTDLRKLIRGGRQLSLHETLNISLQVTEALDYAHGHGIIHRDIKPANVMVDSQGRTKLADFGIAAAIDEASLTATGQIIGTPEYMSPEQAKGGPLDCRSDLYSLGMLIYEMLTGRTPYHQVAKTAILGKLLYDPEELRLEFPSTVPSFLQAIVEDLLRKDPEHLTSDAGTLVKQLRDVLLTLPAPHISEDTEATVIASSPKSVDQRTTSRKEIPALVSPSVQFSQWSATLTYPSAKHEDSEKTDFDPFMGSDAYSPAKRSSIQDNLDKTDIFSPGPSSTPQHRPSLWTRLKIDRMLSVAAPLVGGSVIVGGFIYYLSNEQKKDGISLPKQSTEIESPVRTTPKIMPRDIGLPDAQLSDFLRTFKDAYEARNFRAIQNLSEMDSSRTRYLQMMLDNYSTINISIEPVSATGQLASAMMTYDRLVKPNGEVVTLKPIARKVRIGIKKEGNEWTKVIW